MLRAEFAVPTATATKDPAEYRKTNNKQRERPTINKERNTAFNSCR